MPPKPKKDAETKISNVVESDYTRKLTDKHSGVLLGSCLVQAFPYEVPTWMPEVLVALAKCLGDPSPIQPTVRTTMAEFKRTHADTWDEDKKKFSDDQLEQLTDLFILPNYYV